MQWADGAASGPKALCSSLVVWSLETEQRRTFYLRNRLEPDSTETKALFLWRNTRGTRTTGVAACRRSCPERDVGKGACGQF